VVGNKCPKINIKMMYPTIMLATIIPMVIRVVLINLKDSG